VLRRPVLPSNITIRKCLDSSLVNSIIRESATVVKKKQQKIGRFRDFFGSGGGGGRVNRAYRRRSACREPVLRAFCAGERSVWGLANVAAD
jgi:hypothetical protein